MNFPSLSPIGPHIRRQNWLVWELLGHKPGPAALHTLHQHWPSRVANIQTPGKLSHLSSYFLRDCLSKHSSETGFLLCQVWESQTQIREKVGRKVLCSCTHLIQYITEIQWFLLGCQGSHVPQCFVQKPWQRSQIRSATLGFRLDILGHSDHQSGESLRHFRISTHW